MELEVLNYEGISVIAPEKSEFLNRAEESPLVYGWFVDAVNQAIEYSEEGNLRQLEVELSRAETLGEYYKLRGIEKFVKCCAEQAVGVCVRENINTHLLKKFSDRYCLFVIGSKD